MDKQFTRNIKESIYRRGLNAPSILSLIPALRPKRAIKALVRFNKTINKVIRKKNKGKERYI